MKGPLSASNKNLIIPLLLLWIAIVSFNFDIAITSTGTPQLHYFISIPEPETHCYDIELHISEWKEDTLCLKLPNWMPGYYQMMNYAQDLEKMVVRDSEGSVLSTEKISENTWLIGGTGDNDIDVSYRIRTARKFVANSYVDPDHAYIVPANTFLYIDGLPDIPVSVSVKANPGWDRIATGLEPVSGKAGEFTAPNFDILFDCPLLLGALEELPSFSVNGIDHRFIGFRPGDFDRILFMDELERVVRAATEIIGEIPYDRYTFIAIGPGMGGIEHLNNTTVSFDGNRLNAPGSMTGMMDFLAHEYFHNYNVKRIRPFELGPFDYDRENRTNLLWVSEGLTVYYASQILVRAGLIDTEDFLSALNIEVSTLERDSGRFHQSLAQASYYTWEEGPFGNFGSGPDRSISIYNKGAVVGMLLDLEIRSATGNNKSLDDVMRYLYQEYYKEKGRGFTDSEFQQVCEQVAGIPLEGIFEYVYTTKEIDYPEYLNKAGLKIDTLSAGSGKSIELVIERIAVPDSLQSAILDSWLGE